MLASTFLAFRQTPHGLCHRNKHDRLVHRRERPYGCDFPGCRQRFGQKGDSKKHMATHERSEARKRAAAAAVAVAPSLAGGEVVPPAPVATVNGRPRPSVARAEWQPVHEHTEAARSTGWRQTELERESEAGDEADDADVEDELTRPDDGGDAEEKKNTDVDGEESDEVEDNMRGA